MEQQPAENQSQLSQYSAGPDWDQAPDFGRHSTLLRALQRLYELHKGPACIVETGTTRDERPQAKDGDGWSTLAWGWFCAQTDGHAYTVDISPEAIETCRRLTAEYATHLHYVCVDSLEFLRQWVEEKRGEIHLLYLDSLDYFDRERSEEHHLAEAEAALPALASCCLVLFDDTTAAQNAADGRPEFGGKGARAIPFLLEQGFKLEWCEEGQALLSRGAPPAQAASQTRQEDGKNAPEQSADRWVPRLWTPCLDPTPLGRVPSHFETLTRSGLLAPYLETIIRLCLTGSKTCECGIEAGYGAIWLSLHGLQAEGIGTTPRLVERARQSNNVLQGRAAFRCGDLFDLYQEPAPHYAVLHHQGVLEHFTVPEIHALLAQQVALADWVVFSVPSVYYPFEQELTDERLLPIEEWRHILSPFDVADLRYYGDPARGGREHLLCVLRGQAADEELRARMQLPAEPYPQGISAIVHTRNEERHIAACLETLAGWTDEIIVCDMESTDQTVEIARRYTDNILLHPLIANFDRARNASAMRAKYRWICYLDADERIPRKLGPRLREFVTFHGGEFEAVTLPFLHYFAGQWMQSLYPGYKAPSLFKNGRFYYHARPHAGAQVEGRIAYFPADDLDQAPLHYSYESLAHYLDKLNRYTETEAANLHQDGQPFHWQQAIRHFVRDFQGYYDAGRAAQDGVHGFLWAFLSGFYRFSQHAKLYERRFRAQQLEPGETAVPQSLEQMLEYALAVARQKPLPAMTPIQIAHDPDAAQVVWSGPLLDPSGYGEECRHFLFALEEAGVAAAGQAIPWSEREVDLDPAERQRLQKLLQRSVAPGFVQVVQNFPPHFSCYPQAGIAIGRTMFETDRLPQDWVQACNRMDYLWVPSEFNRRTFRQAGVEAKKLAVIPGCFDPVPYQHQAVPTRLSEEIAQQGRFTFLTVFDWTRHKGWDVLLQGFLEAFEGRDDVSLVLKVWSTQGYTDAQSREQAAEFTRRELDHDLLRDGRIRFVQNYLSREEMLALYQAAGAFVLPSRGEGWGRPYMEAMACGLPTLGTNWSGNTAFMTEENSYLIDCAVQPVSEAGWRELPLYRGHRWAEPNVEHLKAQMRRAVEERGEAGMRGQRAREEVTSRFSRQAVGRLMAQEIERVREEMRPHPIGVAATQLPDQAAEAEASKAQAREKSASTQPATSAKGKRARKASKQAGTTASLSSEQSHTAGTERPSHAAASAASSLAIPALRWEGAQFCRHSLALVNREFCLALLNSGKAELSVIPTEADEFTAEQDTRLRPLQERSFAPLSRPVIAHVRHHFPPRLNPPDEGHFVLMQPWEYGFLPKDWVGPIREHVSEVWCYSYFVRDVYRASGIPEEKLQVVPLGVDTAVFTPDAPPYVFTTEAGADRLARPPRPCFTFLFVGGTIHRKGIDLLIEAYLRAFSAYDDVCLVIKDTGTNTVYRGQNARKQILQVIDDPTRPRLLYLEDDLTPHQMAGLYTAADCLVQPYRGEGFCLPALEAMACGRPVLVPEGGPTDDFVDEAVGWRVAAQRRPMPEGKVGPWECVDAPWLLEVDVDALALRMRQVVQDREEVARRGAAAAERVRQGWTWQHACASVLNRLEALAHQPVPERRQPPLTLSTSPPKRPQPRISLCMIVKDEERVLGNCLQSVKPWVDELIVVDTGSTDRTVEIAERYGAQVSHFPWCDDFAAARNASLAPATGEWIFWLDADDTLPPQTGAMIRNAVSTVPEEIVGFVIPVQFVDDGSSAGGTRVDHVKLFRNRPDLRWEGRIHEQILASLRKEGGQIARLDAVVLHSGYDTSPEGQAKKKARDAKLLKLDLQDRPDHPFVLFNLGMTDHYGSEHAGAARWLRRSIEVSDPSDSHVRKAYALLAVSLRELGREEEALQTLEEGLKAVPGDPELHFQAGYLLSAQGKLAEAKEHYQKTLQAEIGSHFSSLDMGILGYKTYHNLAGLCLVQGYYMEARDWWLKAISAAPQFLPSVFELFNAALEAKDGATAQQMLEAVRSREGNSANWASMQARYAEMLGDTVQAEQILRQAVDAMPELPGPRLSLSRLLLQGERAEEAKEHLLVLNDLGAAEAAFYLGVCAIRQGELAQALSWMERAQFLNPDHLETKEQICNLKQAMGEQ